MTMLITGVSGQVGSRFARRMLDRHRAVRVLVRTEPQANGWKEQGADVVVGDLREPDTHARAVAGVAAVAHIAAAFRGVPDEEAYAVNREATIALADAAIAAGVSRFVFASTNLVYGPGRGRPNVETDEPAWAEGFGAYPASKRDAEAALLDRPELGVRILRLAYVYGEGDPHLAQAMRWAATWPAHQRMQLVHHADVSQGLWLALNADGIDGRIYNIADDAPVTGWELHELNNVPYTAESQELADPWWGIVSNRKARAELGFRPIYPTVYTALDAGAL